MKARKLICMALCIIMLFSLTVPAFAAKPTTATFTDTKGNWAEHEIALVADAGIVGGYPDGSFRPNNNITREQFARVVANFMGYTEEADLSQYTDVNPSDGLTPFVARCVKAGVMGGYSATRMAPKNNITREQAAAMLCRAFKLDTTGLTGNFTDRDSITPGLRAEVAALEMTGLIAGYPDGSFRPKANLNRAQMMAIISRLLPDNEGKIISIISSSGGVTMPCDILDDHSMEFFIPNSVIQAGDIKLKILIEKLPPIKGVSATMQAMINKLAQSEINETIKTGASGEFNPKESFPNAFNFNFATVKMSINGKEFTVNSYGREGADGNKVISTPTNFTAADTAIQEIFDISNISIDLFNKGNGMVLANGSYIQIGSEKFGFDDNYKDDLSVSFDDSSASNTEKVFSVLKLKTGVPSDGNQVTIVIKKGTGFFTNKGTFVFKKDIKVTFNDLGSDLDGIISELWDVDLTNVALLAGMANEIIGGMDGHVARIDIKLT